MQMAFHKLPKLSMGPALSHLEQEAGCIYVGPLNPIMHLGYHSTEGLA